MFKVAIILLMALLSISASGLNDPTRPSSFRRQVATDGKLNLESILVGKERKVAVINGTVVSVGDSIGMAKVILIDRNKVRMLSEGRIVELVLRSISIRQEK